MAKNKDGFEAGQEVTFEQIVAAEAARKAKKPEPKPAKTAKADD